MVFVLFYYSKQCLCQEATLWLHLTFTIAFEEPHKAYTLLTPEASFYSVNNTHARLILELRDNIHSAQRWT